MRDNLSQRPKLDVPRTAWDYVGEALALTGAVVSVLLPVMIWVPAPAFVSRTVGFEGDPTTLTAGFADYFFPVMTVAHYVGLTLLARIPHYFNYPWSITEQNAPIMYRLGKSMITWTKVFVVWLFVLIHLGQLQAELGDSSGVHPVTIGLFLVLIHVVLGIFIYRAYKSRDGSVGQDPSTFRR